MKKMVKILETFSNMGFKESHLCVKRRQFKAFMLNPSHKVCIYLKSKTNENPSFYHVNKCLS